MDPLAAKDPVMNRNARLPHGLLELVAELLHPVHLPCNYAEHALVTENGTGQQALASPERLEVISAQRP